MTNQVIADPPIIFLVVLNQFLPQRKRWIGLRVVNNDVMVTSVAAVIQLSSRRTPLW